MRSGAASTPDSGQVSEGSPGFQRVPVQRLGQVPEGSSADAEVRFGKVPVQRL